MNKELKQKREDCKEGLPGDGVHSKVSSSKSNLLIPSQDDIADKMLEILSQLTPAYLEFALHFVEQEAIQSIRDNVSASPALAGEQYQ